MNQKPGRQVWTAYEVDILIGYVKTRLALILPHTVLQAQKCQHWAPHGRGTTEMQQNTKGIYGAGSTLKMS